LGLLGEGRCGERWVGGRGYTGVIGGGEGKGGFGGVYVRGV